MFQNNKSIIISSPCMTLSGYGAKSREFVRYFLSKKNKFNIFLDALKWGNTPWTVNKQHFNGLIGDILQHCTPPPQNSKPDINLEVRIPNEVSQKGNFNILATSLVETDICNPEWLEYLNKMNLILVPSKFNVETIQETQKKFNKLVIPPIEIIPEGFSDTILNPNIEPLKIDIPKFSFLIAAQLTGNNPFNDRKNVFFTIKWLCEVFKDDKDVGIVVKTNAGRNTILDRNNCENVFKKLLQEVRKSEYPKFHLLHGFMTDEEMVGLYKHPNIKALVALTRGESFGRHLLESASSALPVIATNASGHLDFLNHGKWIKINYEKKPIDPSLLNNKNIFVQGMQWFEAQEEDFKKKVLKFRTSSAIPKEWATELAKTIKKEYNFRSITQKYEEVFKKYNIL